MADDGIIRIGTSVDLSNLRTGMTEAQAAVKTATANMAAAQAEFGKAAEAGNQQAAEALQLYRTELAAAQSAVASLSGTEARETQVLRDNITARMAAGAELRVLEGNVQGSTRAVAALISQFPALASVAQAAFVPFAAFAAVGIMASAVEGVKHLIDAFRNLDGIENLAAEDAIIAGDKIVKATAAKFTLDNFARISAGAPANHDIDLPQASAKLKEIQYAHELADAQAAINEQGKTGVALQLQKIKDAQQDVTYARQASAEAEKLVQSYRDMLAAKISVTHEVFGHGFDGISLRTTQIAAITDPKQVAAIEQQTRTAEQAVEEFNHQLDMAKVKLEGANLKLPSVETKGDNQEAQKKLRGFETAFEQERAAQTQNVFAERAFWQSKLSAFQEGSTEYLSVLSKVANLTAQIHKEETEAVAKYTEQQIRAGEEASRSIADLSRVGLELAGKQAANIMRSGDAWDGYTEAVARSSEIQDQNKASIAEASIAFEVATGRMTKLGAAHALAAIHAADYTAKLKDLEAELAKLKENEKLDPVTGQNTDPGNAKAQQDVQNQIKQMQGQSAVSAISDQSKIQQQIAQPWLNAFQQINEGWLQVQNKMLFTTRNIGQDFQKMGQNLVIWGLDSAEKWALQWIEKELLTVVFHHTANASKVASDAATAATSSGIEAAAIAQQTGLKIASNVAQAQSNAAVAATAALAMTADPAYAAAIFALSETFAAMASFDTGTGYVPRDGVAMLHAGEAVIPAPTMEELRGSGGGGDINVNHTTNINAATDRAIIAAIRRNPHEIANAMQRHMRQRGLSSR